MKYKGKNIQRTQKWETCWLEEEIEGVIRDKDTQKIEMLVCVFKILI